MTTLADVPKALRPRAWYCSAGAYAFLVDAPITFGHSQLRVTVKRAQTEEQAFEAVSVHVTKCLAALRRALSPQSRKLAVLASYTGTSGKYIKTLVFRASAKESKAEYKVHLIPYFASHLRATARLHSVMQNRDSTSPGGLLHWVGQLERIVDHDVRDRDTNKAVAKRIASFKLPELASELRSVARVQECANTQPNFKFQRTPPRVARRRR